MSKTTTSYLDVSNTRLLRRYRDYSTSKKKSKRGGGGRTRKSLMLHSSMYMRLHVNLQLVNLPVPLAKVDFAENRAASQLVRKI
jgi:hypothetical protein